MENIRPGDLDRFIDLAQKNVDYLVIRTEVNLATGIGTAVILSLLGVKYAIFWGFLAFLLGFIPNIGFWIAIVPPMLLAWFDLGPLQALLVLAGSGLMDYHFRIHFVPPLHSPGTGTLYCCCVHLSFFLGMDSWRNRCSSCSSLNSLVQMACELSDETRWIGFLLGPPPDRNEEKK